MYRLGRLILPVVATLAGACAEPSAPAVAAQITVDVDTVASTGRESISITGSSIHWLRLEFPYALTNTGPSRINMFNGCLLRIEELVDGEWHTALRGGCLAVASPPDWIERGETRSGVLTFSASLAGPGDPDWEGQQLPGTYRLAVGLVYEGLVSGSIPYGASNAFVIKGPGQ